MSDQNRKSMIQQIKIGQKQLNMDDESYRVMLMRLTGKNSATKCTIAELSKILYELKQKGAKLAWFGQHSLKSHQYSPTTGRQIVKSQIAHKIRATWIEMGKQGILTDRSEQGLNRYMQKIFKNRPIIPLHVGVLNDVEAIKLLEILKKWQARLSQQEAK